MSVYKNGVEEVAKVGGLYGINVETLGADKTLTPGTDKIYQYLDEGGADRIITLATAGAVAGDRFVIRHNGAYDDTCSLDIQQAGTSLDEIYAGAVKELIFNGVDWISREIGTGETDFKSYNITIGRNANAYNIGLAIGREADGHLRGIGIGYEAWGMENGVAIGYHTYGNNNGVAIGYEAQGKDYGVAIGYYTKSGAKKHSIAIGYYSHCIRTSETSINIDGYYQQKNNVVQGRWSGSTTNNTPKELFCGDIANERFTIRASSALAFRMTIVARDNVANEVAMYTVADGLIKRDAADNTVMVNCTVTTVHEDDAGWDVAVTADDDNEALIITVTGDAANPVQWAAVMDGVETHF